MRSLKTSSIVAAIASSTAFVASAIAAPTIPWTTPNGSTSTFSWSGGGSDNGLFGSPSLIDVNGISLAPAGFKATAANGSASQVSDRLEVDLAIVQPEFGPRKDFDKIHIREFGDLALFSAPNSFAAASVGGALFVTVLESLAGPVVGDPGYVQVLPGTVFGDGGGFATYGNGAPYQAFPAIASGPGIVSINRLWDGTFSIDLPAGVTKVKIVLNNILQATAGIGSVATIEKKAVGIPVNIEIFQGDIPEPTTMLVLGSAGVLLLRRRNRA